MNRTLGPHSVDSLLNETFSIYKNNFWRLAAIMLVGAVPGAIIGFLFNFAMPAPAEAMTSGHIALLFLLIPLYLVTIVVGVLISGAAIHAVAQQYFNHPIDIGRAFGAAWNRLGSMVGASILILLAIFGMSITIIGIPAAIYFTITWLFMLQVIMLEGCGPRTALSYSSSLVKNSWWRVLGIMLLFYVIMMGFYMILYIPAFIGTMIWAVFGVVSGAAPPDTAQMPLWLLLMIMAVVLIVTTFVTPIFSIGTTLLYFDRRVRKEGYNLDRLAGELGLPGTATDSMATPPG
jgi:hypothetical protein